MRHRTSVTADQEVSVFAGFLVACLSITSCEHAPPVSQSDLQRAVREFRWSLYDEYTVRWVIEAQTSGAQEREVRANWIRREIRDEEPVHVAVGYDCHFVMRNGAWECRTFRKSEPERARVVGPVTDEELDRALAETLAILGRRAKSPASGVNEAFEEALAEASKAKRLVRLFAIEGQLAVVVVGELRAARRDHSIRTRFLEPGDFLVTPPKLQSRARTDRQ